MPARVIPLPFLSCFTGVFHDRYYGVLVIGVQFLYGSVHLVGGNLFGRVTGLAAVNGYVVSIYMFFFGVLRRRVSYVLHNNGSELLARKVRSFRGFFQHMVLGMGMLIGS